jgi:hypothetical protein
MTPPTAFLALPESTLGERVAARSRGECAVLPLSEPRVRVEGGEVVWHGVRLDRLSAVCVEAPLCPWPQPIAEARAGDAPTDVQRRGMAHRERNALHVAALRLVARSVRVANEPTHAAELAMSPALALDRLAVAGVPVRPWKIGPAPIAGVACVAAIAPRGIERASVSPCLGVELDSRGVTRHLCVGGEWLGATRTERELAPLARPLTLAPDVPSADREVAVAALAALGLDFGCVSTSGGAVAFVESAALLDAWDLACEGRVADALARWLARSPLTKS